MKKKLVDRELWYDLYRMCRMAYDNPSIEKQWMHLKAEEVRDFVENTRIPTDRLSLRMGIRSARKYTCPYHKWLKIKLRVHFKHYAPFNPERLP